MRPQSNQRKSRLSIDRRYAAIYAVVQRIPRGKVSSYGAVATLAGLPRNARLVGTALKLAPKTLHLHWHRVLTANGQIAFPQGSEAYLEQCRRLMREGVAVTKQRVDMREHAWPSRNISLDELLWRN
jgi:methylated-DNA-protein-cysteine methyltransferase related protein